MNNNKLLNFNIPVHVILNNTTQVLIIQCSQNQNIWTCSNHHHPNSIGVNPSLQDAIHELIHNIKQETS